MIFRISCILWFLGSVNLSLGQIDLDYLQHLSSQNLKLEHGEYLQRLKPTLTVDSCDYFWSKYFLQYHLTDSLLSKRPLRNSVFQQDTMALLLTALWALEDPYSPREALFSILDSSRHNAVGRLKRIEQMGLAPKNFPMQMELPMGLQESWQELRTYSKKSPLKAALCSAILPGSGKWYAQRSNTALVNTVGMSLFAAQTIESIRKLGWDHALTIGNVTVFAIFYSGNIVGSAKAVKVRQIELRNKFYRNAAYYYRRHYRPVLY
jgi:hypothetical protein